MRTVNSNDAERIENFPLVWHGFKAVDDIVSVEQHYLVFIDGDNYSVQHKNNPPEIKKSEELPDFIRRNVGLLKLTEDGSLQDNIGIRVNENTFIVVSNNVSKGE
jgi:hypothetical protein